MFTDSFFMDYIDYAKDQSVNTETSFRCRLQCPACARTTSSDPQKRIKQGQDIKEEYFEMLFQTFRMVHLCGQISDPIYHPRFLNLLQIKYSKYKHKNLGIHTNGSGKKDSWWDNAFDLTDEKTKWIFALDGFTQDVANVYRVGTNAENVKQVMSKGAQKGLTIEWQYLVFEHNEHEVETAKEFALDNNIIFALSRPDRFGKNNPWLKPSTKKEWVNKSENLTIDATKYTLKKEFSNKEWLIRDKTRYKK